MKLVPEIQHILPPIGNREYEALVQSIRTHGCIAPLVVWGEEGLLLDGYVRYNICANYGFPFAQHIVSLPHLDAALRWRANFHIGRRNLAPFELLAQGVKHAGWRVGDSADLKKAADVLEALERGELQNSVRAQLREGLVGFRQIHQGLMKKRDVVLKGKIAKVLRDLK
jgi:hypothetical protein